MLQLRAQMPRVGTRKLHHLLKDTFEREHLKMGRDGLFRLLGKEGLLVPRRKRYTVTTDSRHWMHKYPNLTKGLSLHRPEQVWVSDITYIDTLKETLYLHLVTDAYSKRIMGYELCGNMEAASTVKALKMAIRGRKYDGELIHHSDRGLQYCSKLYVDELKRNNIKISMTENGSPYENAVAERINGILKDEFGLAKRLNDIAEGLLLAEQGISAYNYLRPHLSCNMLTPAEMHQQSEIKIKTYKKSSGTF